MYCSHCKKYYEEDIKICPECHEELKDLFDDTKQENKQKDNSSQKETKDLKDKDTEEFNNISDPIPNKDTEENDNNEEDFKSSGSKGLSVLLFVLIFLSFGSACYFLISYQMQTKASEPVVGAMTTPQEKEEQVPFEAHIEDEIAPEHEKAFIKEAGQSKPSDRNPVPAKKEEKKEEKEEKEEKKESASFKPGVYVLNYDMNMREKGSAGSASKGLVDAGSKVTVTEIVIDSDKTVWGHTSEGYWICLKDSSIDYAKAS